MTDEEWEALSEGLRQCSMHHVAGHANFKDPSMTPGTWPPHGELDHQGKYYWVHSERSFSAAIVQWMGNMWYLIGEHNQVTPQELRRRGWEMLDPATPPQSVFIDD